MSCKACCEDLTHVAAVLFGDSRLKQNLQIVGTQSVQVGIMISDVVFLQ